MPTNSLYKRTSQPLAFGTSDVNLTSFGLNPISFQTSRKELQIMDDLNTPYKPLVNMSYKKLCNNLNKVRPGGKTGPLGPKSVRLPNMSPRMSEGDFMGQSFQNMIPDYTGTPFVNHSPTFKQKKYNLGNGPLRLNQTAELKENADTYLRTSIGRKDKLERA